MSVEIRGNGGNGLADVNGCCFRNKPTVVHNVHKQTITVHYPLSLA